MFRPGMAKGPSLSSSQSVVPVVPGAYPAWFDYNFTHTDFQAAALTNDVLLYTLPAAYVLHGYRLKTSVAFAGTGITQYQLSMGIVGDLEKYAPLFDVDDAVSAYTYQLLALFNAESYTAGTALRMQAVSVGANLNQSTAGTCLVQLLISNP